MNKTEAINTAKNAVHVIYNGGWCVMAPYFDNEPSGPNTEIRCIDYFQAVYTARRRKIALAVSYVTECSDFDTWGIEYELETNDDGDDWRTVVRKIANDILSTKRGKVK